MGQGSVPPKSISRLHPLVYLDLLLSSEQLCFKDKNNHLYFKDGTTKAQRGHVTCPRSHSISATGPALIPAQGVVFCSLPSSNCPDTGSYWAPFLGAWPVTTSPSASQTSLPRPELLVAVDPAPSTPTPEPRPFAQLSQTQARETEGWGWQGPQKEFG